MKKTVSIGIASLMTAQLMGPAAQAQFEDFPPPPPPPDFGDSGSPGFPPRLLIVDPLPRPPEDWAIIQPLLALRAMAKTMS